MKSIFTYLFFFISTVFYAQNISYNGTTYTVKGEKIFNNTEEVTSTLTDIDKEAVFNAHKTELKKLKDIKKADKKLINAQKEEAKRVKAQEKKLKAAEKKLKKAKKEAKKRESIQKSLEKAENKLKKETKNYKRLLKKGKLSSEDNIKFQKKINTFKDNVNKMSKKLRKL